MYQIALLGDLAFNGIISSRPELNRERFSKVGGLLNTFDLVIANLETPVRTGDDFNENKDILLYSSKEVTSELLKMLNIGCVSLANNHIYDYKMSGLKATIDLLDTEGIYHTGAGYKVEHIEPIIIERRSYKIGFMAYIDQSTNPKTESFPELLINYFDLPSVINDIASIKKHVDIIICSIHWGNDYSNYYTREQQNIARLLIREGVNIIAGHHPHTVQPFELYHGSSIFYSLGQLCFGDMIWEGELKALKRKTKTGIIPVLDPHKGILRTIQTHEKRGNTIEISNINVNSKMARRFRINELILKYRGLRMIILAKESVFDRIYEFIFGYYRNPFKDIFKLKTYKKIRYLIRDIRSGR